MAKRLKVLLSAFACEPNKGSEPAVGWNWTRQMSRHHDLWVITWTNYREAIESDPFTRENPHVHWVYYELPPAVPLWQRSRRDTQYYYLCWQAGIGRLARKLHRQVQFDLIHHVTWVRYWTPCFLALLPPPLIFGPVGGGETGPDSFYSSFGFRGNLFERVRDFVRWSAEHEPFARATVRRAAAVFATTEQTADRVKKMGGRNVSVMTSFALTPEEFAQFGRIPPKAGGPFRLISIGRLLHWKGFHLGLRAFARFLPKCPDSEYWIVNDGPEFENLKRLARELGIADRVVFWGRLPRLADVHDKLAQSDVLVHPSLHDNFGNVCLEALAAGRPVLCLDWGGPGLQVTEECGLKVLPRTPEQTVDELAAAMTRLQQNPELRARMGESGRRRAREHFSWDRKGEEMDGIYEQIVARATGRPA